MDYKTLCDKIYEALQVVRNNGREPQIILLHPTAVRALDYYTKDIFKGMPIDDIPNPRFAGVEVIETFGVKEDEVRAY